MRRQLFGPPDVYFKTYEGHLLRDLIWVPDSRPEGERYLATDARTGERLDIRLEDGRLIQVSDMEVIALMAQDSPREQIQK